MQFVNIKSKISSLSDCNVLDFNNSGDSFTRFVLKLVVRKFRHISDLDLSFDCGVTAISGTNKIGKTSILLLLACSHENFMRMDSSKPEPTWRKHGWKDVISFTKHESESNDYLYELSWRVGQKNLSGSGKRLASSRAWSGLGKSSSDAKRINAKIRSAEVRLIDLDRLLPPRNFSQSLLKKSSGSTSVILDNNISKAFFYIMDIPYNENFEIKELGAHVNKRCYLLSSLDSSYSSYGAATGEEALINLLRDVLEAPNNSLILIDEVEAGFHPSVQRKLVEVICQISWEQKKQIVMTTHSATVLDTLPPKARKFIEKHNGVYKVISDIAPQTALSKMDAIAHPLLRLFCEDDVAEFLIRSVMTEISNADKNFSRQFEIIRSGAADMVKNDYERHKFFYSQLRNKIGYCAVIDGDYRAKNGFSELENSSENVHFIYPYSAPEKFLARAFLDQNPNDELEVFLENDNIHAFFSKMVSLDLATDKNNARDKCYNAFKSHADFDQHFSGLRDFLNRMVNAITA